VSADALFDSWVLEGTFVAYKAILLSVAVAAASSVAIALVFSGFRALRRGREASFPGAWLTGFCACLPFVALTGLIGAFTGQLGGSSRDSVVGDLVPAVFTLFGGYMIYYMGQKQDQGGRITLSSLSFLLCFFSMYNVASVVRQSNENWQFCRELFSNPDFNTVELRVDRHESWGLFCQSVFDQWTKPVIPPPAEVDANQAGPETLRTRTSGK
jgi:hypothetical protein